jgi:hypothetical protein
LANYNKISGDYGMHIFALIRDMEQMLAIQDEIVIYPAQQNWKQT